MPHINEKMAARCREYATRTREDGRKKIPPHSFCIDEREGETPLETLTRVQSKVEPCGATVHVVFDEIYVCATDAETLTAARLAL